VFERPHLRKRLVSSRDGATAWGFGMVREVAQGLDNALLGTNALLIPVAFYLVLDSP
jgi:hypothetical protein